MEIHNSKRLFYTALRLSGIPQFDTYDFESAWVLPNLSTVNIFVGANNSGKSRFLRSLFRTANFGFKTNFFNGDEFQHFLRQTKSDYVKQVYLDLPMKSGIFEVQQRGKLADSDPRLQVLLREQQGVRRFGTATVSETVSKKAGGNTTSQNSAELR
jgi:hypothetical protein